MAPVASTVITTQRVPVATSTPTFAPTSLASISLVLPASIPSPTLPIHSQLGPVSLVTS